jgi:hypothetical protein
MFTSICNYVAMTYTHVPQFKYEIQSVRGSEDSCCGVLGYDTLQPGT